MLGKTLRALLTTLLVTSSIAAPQQKQSYFSSPPSPQGELLISKPDLCWQIWGKENLKVTTVNMSLDGEDVEANYNSDSQEVNAKLTSELSDGRHNATCTVKFNTGQEVKESWSFVVLPEANPELPISEPHQVLIQHRVNQIRRIHGLKPVSINSSLNAAAESHAKYMDANRTAGHKEQFSKPGFTGVTPGGRANAFGFYGRNSESVATSQQGPIKAVNRLFAAPYHRVMFLHPGSPEFGSGYLNGSACLKFGGSQKEGVIVSPPEGGVDVPRFWDGVETPDPLRNNKVRGAVGYPIVLAAFGTHSETLRLKSAQLHKGGESLPMLKLDPSNDEKLKDAIILIPRIPLEARTKYRVRIEYAMNGQTYTKELSFTTAR